MGKSCDEPRPCFSRRFAQPKIETGSPPRSMHLPAPGFFRSLDAWKYTSLPRLNRGSRTSPRRADAERPPSLCRMLSRDISTNWRRRGKCWTAAMTT